MNNLEKFIIARWMYSIGEPIMEDAEYTILHSEVAKEYPDSPYLRRSWSSDPCPIQLLRDNGYSDAIRDITLSDKTESIPSVNSWALLRSLFGGLNEPATLSYKDDGWNIQASYYNGELVRIQTRGRSSDALSAQALKDSVPQIIPKLGRVTVCMEATISDSDYVTVKSLIESRSQRGAVVSCLTRPSMLKYITLHAFSIIGDEQMLNPFYTLREWGFNTVEYVEIQTYEELLKAMQTLTDRLQAYGSPTDGLVVRTSSMTRAIRLGAWEEAIYKSFVTGYEETYGAYRVGVKAKVYPIAMRNSTQTKVSCTNYQCIIDNNLRIGYPIAYKLTSAAIATLDATSTGLLQEEWKGREEEYCDYIRKEEEAKGNIPGAYADIPTGISVGGGACGDGVRDNAQTRQDSL